MYVSIIYNISNVTFLILMCYLFGHTTTTKSMDSSSFKGKRGLNINLSASVVFSVASLLVNR